MSLQFIVNEVEGVASVEISGSLDEETYKPFRKKVRRFVDEGWPFIVLNVGELELDEEGINAFVGAVNGIREFGGDVRLTGPGRAHLLEAVRASGLCVDVRQFESVEEGLASFKSV